MSTELRVRRQKSGKPGLKATTKIAVIFLLLGSFTAAEDLPSKKAPFVTMEPAPAFTVPRGKPTRVTLQFQVAPGFHINSHKPNSQLLIPTTLKLDPPTDIVAEKIAYPAGKDFTFSFDPSEKLNVYSGAFVVTAMLRPLSKVAPSPYTVRGNLKYQACDDRACYPPKQLPVEFEIKVVKGAVKHSAGKSRQSPHVHN